MILVLLGCEAVTVVFPDTGTPDTEPTLDDSGGCGPLPWYRDADGDAHGDPDVSAEACEAPEGYVEDATDCDDGDSSANPEADEVCDGADNDCDAEIDEDGAGGGTEFYRDEDGDGWGTSEDATVDCAAPEGYVATSGDCDDGDSARNPGVEEVAHNLLDDDCDGRADPMEAADEAALTLLGAEFSDTIGSAAVLPVGDADGDGSPDLLVAAPNYGNAGGTIAFHDAATLAQGTSLAAGWLLVQGDEASDRFGSAVTFLGDPDGDGLDEVAVGAPQNNASSFTDCGRVFVFDLAQDLDAAATLTGLTEYGYLGGALGSGDVDGDGVVDLVAGAVGESGERGEVHLLLGSQAWYSGALYETDAGWSVKGTSAGDALGTVATVPGDLTGDAYDDVLACAPGHDTSGTDAGACWLFAGSAVPEAADASAPDLAVATFSGAVASDAMGYAAQSAAAADFDDDGSLDLALGVPGWDGLEPGGGAVVLFFGSGLAGSFAPEDADAMVLGRGALGRALAVGDDADADGAPDLLAGSPTPDEGTVFRLSSIGAGDYELPGDELASWTGEVDDDWFGMSIGGGADVDGDTIPDVVVAATASDEAATAAGKVYVLPGYR